uniref:Uncharacterized protein n=1 Tax=Romanomermis culicivorax TaxID=13658 RepID=A0A915KUU6_ROMCU
MRDQRTRSDVRYISELNMDHILVDRILRSYFNAEQLDAFQSEDDRNSRRKFLFRQSDFNIFKENFYVQGLFYHILKRYLKNCSPTDRKTLLSRYCNFENLMNLAARILKSPIIEMDAEYFTKIYVAATKVWSILDLKLKFDGSEMKNCESGNIANSFVIT